MYIICLTDLVYVCHVAICKLVPDLNSDFSQGMNFPGRHAPRPPRLIFLFVFLPDQWGIASSTPVDAVPVRSIIDYIYPYL